MDLLGGIRGTDPPEKEIGPSEENSVFSQQWDVKGSSFKQKHFVNKLDPL